METFRLSDSVLPSVDTNNAVSLSRVSDSEFISILPSIQNDADITWAVYRMMQVLNIPVEIDGHEIVMTANVGISIYPSDAQEVDALLNHAKMALVDAREKGRGEFLFYNKEMNINAKRALQLESQLHLALERDELYLNFQPIILPWKQGALKK
ncbi:MAG: diguanylate cyclase [Epsilonproteobacteria bacterium]|nr:diguanylate cyclase [Campylobacterota bacterium]